MVGDNKLRLQELAKFALDGISHLQTYYGYHQEKMGLMLIAQRIHDYMTKAWAHVVDLHLAFESRSLNRTESDKRVLSSQIESISELERIAGEAGGVEEEVDWHFTLLLDTIDEATQRLIDSTTPRCVL